MESLICTVYIGIRSLVINNYLLGIKGARNVREMQISFEQQIRGMRMKIL